MTDTGTGVGSTEPAGISSGTLPAESVRAPPPMTPCTWFLAADATPIFGSAPAGSACSAEINTTMAASPITARILLSRRGNPGLPRPDSPKLSW